MDPFRNYDDWKLRSPEDEEDEENRRLDRISYEEDRADEMYDRMKDERYERNCVDYRPEEE